MLLNRGFDCNFMYSLKHTVKKSKETKIAKHPSRFLIYGGKMLGKFVETLKKKFYRCPFLQSQAK